MERNNNMSNNEMSACLEATELLDADHPLVIEIAKKLTAASGRDFAELGAIYRYVREMPYDILNSFRYLAQGKRRASDVLEAGHAFCMGKASAFVSLCRASGIPARVGFQQLYCPDKIFMSEEVRTLWGDRPLPWHSLGEAYLDGRWLKLDATIPADVAQSKGRPYIREFDGVHDIPTVEGPIVKEIGSFADYPADIAEWYERMAKEVMAAESSAAVHVKTATDDHLWSGPDAQELEARA